MAFSLLAGRSWLLGLLTLAILAAGGLFLRRFRLGALPRFGALLVLSGGLSNAWDRFFAGYVTDMLELLFVRFAIFNVADVCVCTGAALCALSLLAAPGTGRRGEETVVAEEIYRCTADGGRLDVLLSRAFGLTRSHCAALMAEGCCQGWTAKRW